MKRFILTALLLVLFAAAWSQNWQPYPARYYQNSSAVISGESRDCENGTAYRFNIELAATVAGSLAVGTPSGTFYDTEPITADTGSTAILDSLVISSSAAHLSDCVGGFYVGDTVRSDTSSAFVEITAVYLTSVCDVSIYIPACNARNITVAYNTTNLELDSIYLDISYGSAWDISPIDPFFETSYAIQDSSSYWYGGDRVHSLDLTPGYFPAPYLVLDIYGLNYDEYSGILNLRVFVDRWGK